MLLLAQVATSMVAITAATKIDRPYCNTAMNTGVIPALPPNATLLQVHVLHRHGSRTKDAASPTGIWMGESNVQYNCTSQRLEGPDATVSPGGAVLFNKVYLPGRNDLHGNCMTGQLVSKGLEMCKASGRNLAKAYKIFFHRHLAMAATFIYEVTTCHEPLLPGKLSLLQCTLIQGKVLPFPGTRWTLILTQKPWCQIPTSVQHLLAHEVVH